MDLPFLLFSVLYLWLCLSMRLCVARHLVLVHHDLATAQLEVSGQVAEDLKEQIVKSTEGTKMEGIRVSERSKLAKEIHPSSGRKELSGLIAPIHKDQHPEFHSDYSVPKTRPPSHN